MAVELTHMVEMTEETFARVARSFDERQIVELIVITGIANLNNRLSHGLLADLEEKVP